MSLPMQFTAMAWFGSFRCLHFMCHVSERWSINAWLHPSFAQDERMKRTKYKTKWNFSRCLACSCSLYVYVNSTAFVFLQLRFNYFVKYGLRLEWNGMDRNDFLLWNPFKSSELACMDRMQYPLPPHHPHIIYCNRFYRSWFIFISLVLISHISICCRETKHEKISVMTFACSFCRDFLFPLAHSLY